MRKKRTCAQLRSVQQDVRAYEPNKTDINGVVI
jgi:hypothetical protein